MYKRQELLDEKGEIDLSNIIVHYRPVDDSDPFQTDIYTLNGRGEETFKPKFNYKGFQFVEVISSKPIELTKESVKGIVMHSDVPPVGKINSSNPLINDLWSATNNSYLSNLFGTHALQGADIGHRLTPIGLGAVTHLCRKAFIVLARL